MIPKRDTNRLLAAIDSIAPTPPPPFELWLPGDDANPPPSRYVNRHDLVRCVTCRNWFDTSVRRHTNPVIDDLRDTDEGHRCFSCAWTIARLRDPKWAAEYPINPDDDDGAVTCSACGDDLWGPGDIVDAPTIDDVTPPPLCQECHELLWDVLDWTTFENVYPVYDDEVTAPCGGYDPCPYCRRI